MKWLYLIVAIGLLAIFSPWIDLQFAHFFYDENQAFLSSPITDYIYKYGNYPGMTLGSIAGIIYLLSFIFPQWKKWRKAALLVGLTLVIGAGLITNAILKEFWGRPRPKQVIEFGGKHAFRPFYKPNFHSRHDPEKSFPSGHTAMGFYFMCLCFVGKRYSNHLIYWIGLTLTIILGFGLMATRIAQGGHFFSDTIFSIIIMWITTALLDILIFTWDVHRLSKGV